MSQSKVLNREVVNELHRVHEERVTGCVRALVGGSPRDLFLRNGAVVGVRTSVEDERIGRLLVRFGLITVQQLDDAMIFVSHGKRLGETLVELQILDAAPINPMVRQQAIEVACAVINAPEVALHVVETPELCTTLHTPLLVADIVMEAVRRVDEVEPLVEAMRADRREFQPCAETVVTEIVGLTPEDLYVFSRFQGGATLDAVFRSIDTDSPQLVRSLLGLVESRMVHADLSANESQHPDAELRAFIKEVNRMHRMLERMDPWSALGMSRDVGTASARDNFRNALRRYHPDRYQRVNDPELHRKLAALCSKFTDAYTCLTTALQMQPQNADESAIALASTQSASTPRPDVATKRANESISRTAPLAPATTTASRRMNASGPNEDAAAPHEPTDGGTVIDTGRQPSVDDPAYDAEVFLREGKRALNRGDYWRAVQLFRQAVQMNDDRAEAHYFLGTALSKNTRWRHDAGKSFRRAIELEPWQRKYYEAMAGLYQSAGMIQRAERVLREADAMGATAGLASNAEIPELLAR